MPLAQTLNTAPHFIDARVLVDFLDQQAVVDTGLKTGSTRYCMGGPIVMRTVAEMPVRLGTAAHSTVVD